MMFTEIVIKVIGLVMILDGIIQMTVKTNNHNCYLDFIRLCRITLGGVLFFI